MCVCGRGARAPVPGFAYLLPVFSTAHTFSPKRQERRVDGDFLMAYLLLRDMQHAIRRCFFCILDYRGARSRPAIVSVRSIYIVPISISPARPLNARSPAADWTAVPAGDECYRARTARPNMSITEKNPTRLFFLGASAVNLEIVINSREMSAVAPKVAKAVDANLRRAKFNWLSISAWARDFGRNRV